jgi:hypothetical protein
MVILAICSDFVVVELSQRIFSVLPVVFVRIDTIYWIDQQMTE